MPETVEVLTCTVDLSSSSSQRSNPSGNDEFSDLLLHGPSVYAGHDLGRGRTANRISQDREKSSSPPHSASATSGSSETNTSPPSPVGAPSSQPKDKDISFTPPNADPFASQQYGATSDSTLNKNAAAIKMLVSNNAAGSIIGRAGQTISELQTESNTRIKLSQSGDYYPGTQDRVCLLQGEGDAVRIALRLLLERLYMMQETQNTPAWHQHQLGTTPTFDFVVRLLVPVSCCGMIIGKNGSNIKLMEDATGVTSIRLSPKDDSVFHSTAERVVSITGSNMESCLHCVYLVLDGMTSHPEISRYSNLTTSYANCALSQAYSPSSIAAAVGQAPLLIHSIPPQQISPRDQQRVLWEIPPTHNPGFSRRSVSTPDLLSSVSASQRTYQQLQSPELAHREISDDYGFSSASPFTPIPIPQPPPHQDGQQQFHLLPRHSPFEGNPPDAPVAGSRDPQQPVIPPSPPVSHSLSAPNLLALQLEQSLHVTPPIPHHHQLAPPHSNYNDPTSTVAAFVPQAPVMIAPGCFTAQILIPDTMIGSILGRGGRTLNELQLLSATRIRISQRGEYMPGTRSRIVTIRGSSDQAVWQAQFLMSQRIVLPPTAYHTHTLESDGIAITTTDGGTQPPGSGS